MAEKAFISNVFGGSKLGTKGNPSTWCDIEQLEEAPVRPPLPSAPPDPTSISEAFKTFPHPLEMTLRDICFLYWNVKEFEISQNLILSQTQRSVLAFIGTITYNITQETISITTTFPETDIKNKIGPRVCNLEIFPQLNYKQSATADFEPEPGFGLDPAFTQWENPSAGISLRPYIGFFFGANPFEPELNRPRVAYFPSPGLNSSTNYFYPLDSLPGEPGPRYFVYQEQPLGSDVSTVAPFTNLVGIGICPAYSFGYQPEDTSWSWIEIGQIEIQFNYSELRGQHPTRVPQNYQDSSYFIPIYGATGFNRNAVGFDQDGNPTAWDYFYIDSVSVSQNLIIKISELTSLT
jgi:hypothetical protein